jgi:hypothetical protein
MVLCSGAGQGDRKIHESQWRDIHTVKTQNIWPLSVPL